MSHLDGKFFIADSDHDHYYTGVVIGTITADTFLVKVDITLTAGACAHTYEICTIAEMTAFCPDCDKKHWSFFDTDADRQAWINFIDGPPSTNALKLVELPKRPKK